MERDINQSALPTLCRGGCGFYGSSATDGLCSKCFKDTLKRTQDPGRVSPTTSITPKSSDNSSAHSVSASSAAAVSAAIENLQATLITGNIAAAAAAETTTTAGVADQASSSVANEQQNVDVAVSSNAPVKQKNRCDQCRKRVGLTGFECRCGGTFCAIHRYSDTHECVFDYKALGEQEIRKNNPVVKTEKVQKI